MSDDRVAQITQYMVASAGDAGFALDAACVRDKIEQLSEDDLALLYSATFDTTPDATIPALSDEGEAIGESTSSCLPGGGGEPGDPEVVAGAIAVVEA